MELILARSATPVLIDGEGDDCRSEVARKIMSSEGDSDNIRRGGLGKRDSKKKRLSEEAERGSKRSR